ncbi:MAG: IPT/TIG domain-containing protein [Planctomycetota bacterium]
MGRRVVFGATLVVALMVAGCSKSNELQIPLPQEAASTTSKFSPVLGPIGGVPSGVQVTFLGDSVAILGKNFSPGIRAFFGMNTDVAFRPNSLMTTDRHILPDKPFVYTDPVSGEETILEVEAGVEYSSGNRIFVTVPAAVACSATFTNPILRFWGGDGSSIPVVDVLHVVGPQCVALAPKRGLDIGDFTVTVHGEFFSPWTQVAIRYRDPMTGNIVIKGNTLATDITEFFIDRNTMVIPSMPGVVPNSTVGLAEPLAADLLLYESIDEIAASIVAEPALNGDPPCNSLRPESSEVPLNPSGTRNSEFNDKFIFLPTGVTDFPSIASVLPESGPEIGGNTVVIHGDQFDAFSADISDPNNPGIGIECPPNSGEYQRPLEAILVDRQTLVITMPECPVEIPQKVNFCIRNKYSMDNKGQVPAAGPNGDCVIFEDVYEYLPIPPIVEPLITAIFPAGEGEQPLGTAHDYGLERLMVVGDWFDGDTTLNGGFEFLLPAETAGDDPVVVQAQRVILHNRNLIEVFTKRLPDEYYPLDDDLRAGIRVRNTVGHADFEDSMVFAATPDADVTPVLTELCGTEGPTAGGNQVIVFGENFDTTTDVRFGATSATDVRFITSGVLVAVAPPGTGTVSVTVVDDGETGTGAADYLYSDGASKSCPALGHLDPNTGSHAGGFTILALGASLTPTTRVEFGENSGNWSQNIFFVSDNLLRVEVPEAFPEQIGATVGVGATDPLNGCDDILKTIDFTYTAAQQAAPQILYVDTTVEVPPQPTDFPALHMTGGDRMLVIGSGFDQTTTFDISKPRDEDLVGEEESSTSSTTAVTVLTPNLAVMTSPETPDGLEGTADLQAHNAFGDSNRFTVEYVQPGPPVIVDVRNLDDGTQTAPIDAEDRLLIFGGNFFRPLTVRLTGCDLNNPESTIQVSGDDVTVLEDHIIGVTVPADTFCEGPLGIEVITDFGTAVFEENDEPVFQLIGPQPPIVEGVFEQTFFSSGGDEVVFFGRFFTETTEFAVRTTASPAGTFIPVIDTRVVSTTVALVMMPPLLGAPSPGLPGSVRAEELDPTLRSKISGDAFTVQDNLFNVVTDDAPILLAVHPDHGSIFGGEQVLLFGENFQKATGDVNVTGIRLFDANLGADVGSYQQALSSELPLGPTDMGLYVVLNDHSILLITNPHATIDPEDQSAPVTVIVESDVGNSQIAGGYTYNNEPAVRSPVLLGITPNQTRLDGGTSHLISGGFLTEADRIVLTRTSDSASLTLDIDPDAPPTDGGHFAEVNDSFLVFVMPDVSGTFAAGDVVAVHAEKDVDGNTLSSNALSLNVTFAGPPVITPDLGETSGPAFGGQEVTISGSLFTTNSQVLFGTMPARHVVYVSPTELIAITPSLPIDVPDPGIDLLNIDSEDGTVDVAVFTQGGWAVLQDAYTFEPVAPVVDPPDVAEQLAEGETTQITVMGSNFVPGSTTVTASAGTVTNVVIIDFNTLTFTYEAPTFDPGTEGPVTVTITIETNQGTATVPLEIEIQLDPFVTETQTSFTGGAGASPTTGIDPVTNTFVVGTLEGGNFVEGGILSITPRLATEPVPLTEIDAGADFSQPGQFRVVDPETIEFSVPNVFSSQVPTILDGNPNIGPVTLTYVTPQGQTATGGSFVYVPSFLDFEEQAFTLPGPGSMTGHVPTHIELGDINQDGMPDAAVLGTNTLVCWVLYANTFGTADVNGDGVTPDFAGSFNRVEVRADEAFKFAVFVGYAEDANKVVRLANLDDDDELEILIPGMREGGDDPWARILIIDTDETGIVGQSVYTPGFSPASEVLTLAVGDFDGDERDDIAYITTACSCSQDRRIATLTSPDEPFVFVEDTAYLPARMDAWCPSKLTAGDFDGDGTDDLMYASMVRPNGNWGPVKKADIFTVDLDGSGNILSQSALTNITASPVVEIKAIKLNDNETDDAIIIVEGAAISDVLPDESEMAGFAIALDPLTTLTADSYTATTFPNVYGALADMNADGVTDLALSRPKGRWTIWLGDGAGGFVDSGRSWTLDTIDPLDKLGGIAAADMNADGMAELFMSDGGSSPVNMVLWVNTSR